MRLFGFPSSGPTAEVPQLSGARTAGRVGGANGVPLRSPDAFRAGFSLVELVVSLGIFIALTAIGATLFLRATSFTIESLLRSDLMETAKVAEERVFDQLFSAKIISLGALNGQPALTAVLPVELPVGGVPPSDFFDAAGQINWGAVEPEGAKLDLPGDPHRLTITFRPSGVAAEKDLDLDLNHDGDLADAFQLGSLAVKTTAGPELRLVVNRLVGSEVGKGDFDLDGDRVADPLFQIAGETWNDANKNAVHEAGETFTDSNKNERWDGVLWVNLLTVAKDRQGRGHSFVYKAGVKLLNN